MREGQIVTWEEYDKKKYGIVSRDPFGSCNSDETPVHVLADDIEWMSIGIRTSLLEAIEADALPPELILTTKHVKEVCKPGRKAETCKFMVAGEGVQCAKGSCIDLMYHIIFKPDMTAQAENCGGRIGSAEMAIADR